VEEKNQVIRRTSLRLTVQLGNIVGQAVAGIVNYDPFVECGPSNGRDLYYVVLNKNAFLRRALTKRHQIPKNDTIAGEPRNASSILEGTTIKR
jgi:hypothetical protein